jgi:YD repeat-containing protein
MHSMTPNLRGLPETSIDTGALNDRYTYDQNGNVASIADQYWGVNNRTMVYDGLDRLTSVAASALWGNSSYSYDALDNLTGNTITAGATARSVGFNYPDPATNRLMSVSGSAGYNFDYAYDSQGNITRRGAQLYTFDQGNRMTSASGLATYGYDGLGHRVSVVGNDGVNRVQVYSQAGQMLQAGPAGGAATRYIYLHNHVIAEVGPSGTQYQHTDALGSPVARTDSAGNVVSEPYGKTAQGATPTLGFTGHVNDADTGLVYMQRNLRKLPETSVDTGAINDSYSYDQNGNRPPAPSVTSAGMVP